MVTPSYTLPSDEDALTGACALEDGFCAWAGPSAYRWAPEAGWTALSAAPAAIDSGFELQSGVLAGAGTHVGFLPTDGPDWAGWVDLSTFSDAHPMYGDLLLCIDASTETYVLFAVSEDGLDPLSTFDAEELADPVAGWSAPKNPERVLLLGEGGLWSLNPPYTDADRQHLVSFDDVDLPAFEDIPAPFQPGPATVVVPRRRRTGLRLDLSDGSGHATGLAHLPGAAALWTAYLQDNEEMAARLLTALARLPAPEEASLRLHDILVHDGTADAFATSAGIHVPPDDRSATGSPGANHLSASPLDASALTTWRLWLDGADALDEACQQLCGDRVPDYALVESLQVFAGSEAVQFLFARLRGDDPPTGPDGNYDFPAAALRALVAPGGEEAAEAVASGLTDSSVPARVAACLMAGALPSDDRPEGGDEREEAEPALWDEKRPLPREALVANAQHDHPAVRAAARNTGARLPGADVPSP